MCGVFCAGTCSWRPRRFVIACPDQFVVAFGRFSWCLAVFQCFAGGQQLFGRMWFIGKTAAAFDGFFGFLFPATVL